MRLHRGPLTFLPKGVIQTPRDRQAGQQDRPAATTSPPGVAGAAPRNGGNLKAWLNEKRSSLQDSAKTSSVPTAVQSPPDKDSLKADLAFEAAVKATTTFGPLLVKGAVRSLGRHLGPIEPSRPIPVAPDLPHMTMPGSFPTEAWAAGGTSPKAHDGKSGHTHSRLQQSVPHPLQRLQQAPERLRQQAENKAADLVFDAAYTAGRMFLNGAVNAASRHLPETPVLPDGERPLMPGTMPGSEESIRELLQPSSPGAEKTTLAGKLGHAARQRQDASKARADDLAFRIGVQSAGLIGQGALQALGRQLASTPLVTSSGMPGAYQEGAKARPEAVSPSVPTSSPPMKSSPPADSEASRSATRSRMPGAWED
ncbi:MAG TPA: hypothetical protein VF169_01255 [Albitalea sp.]|uniref:hypothetical protein n=1 Tax=Piscinibacter sp. TaxID=1903157 RepID=UPI002ED44443